VKPLKSIVRKVVLKEDVVYVIKEHVLCASSAKWVCTFIVDLSSTANESIHRFFSSKAVLVCTTIFIIFCSVHPKVTYFFCKKNIT